MMKTNLPLTALRLIVKEYGHRGLLTALKELTNDYKETGNVKLIDLRYILNEALENFKFNLQDWEEAEIERLTA